jgi:hypothetical protein
MKKTSGLQFFLTFLLSYSLFAFVYCLISFQRWWSLDFESTTKLAFLIGVIFTVGASVAMVGLNQKKNAFVGYFIGLTVLQMIAFLAVEAAIFFTQVPDFRIKGIHFLVLFLSGLILETIFLVLHVKKSA